MVAGFDSAFENVAGRQKKSWNGRRFEWVQVTLFGFVVIKDVGDVNVGTALEAREKKLEMQSGKWWKVIMGGGLSL